MAAESSCSPLKNRFEPEVLTLLCSLELKARYVVESFLSGLHGSPFHGTSTDFSEYRQYHPGDELRQLDWRVYARSDRLCIKRFTAETNAHFYVICDTSGSMGYRGQRAWGSKLECSCVMAAAMSWLMLRQNDAVGLLSLSEDDATTERFGSSRTTSQYTLMVRQLEQLRAAGGARLPALLSLAVRLVRRRSIIVLFSDLLEPSETVKDCFSELRFLGHDCMVFQVLDHDELEFPFDNTAIFEDLETGARRRVSPRAARQKYLRRFESFMSRRREIFERLEIPHCVVRTDEDPWQVLARFLQERGRLI